MTEPRPLSLLRSLKLAIVGDRVVRCEDTAPATSSERAPAQPREEAAPPAEPQWVTRLREVEPPDPYREWDETPVDEDAKFDDEGDDLRTWSESHGRFLEPEERERFLRRGGPR